MTRWIDITQPLSEGTPVWPGDPPVRIERLADRALGAEATVSRIDLGAHAGTHVDAPLHYISSGADVASLRLDVLCGPCWVADVPGAAVVDATALESLRVPPGVSRLLLATGSGNRRGGAFDRTFRGVSVEGAAWLVDRGMALLGTDAPSIAPYESGTPTHVALLEAGVVVVENLALAGVEPGAYDLICLPLRMVGVEASPARVVLSRPD